MVEEIEKSKRSSWKWMAAAVVLGVVVKLVMDWLWPYSSKFGRQLWQIYDLVDALLIPINFIWLVWRKVVGADLPSFIYDLYLYEAANAAIYALFGYLLWRVKVRGWHGYAAFGSTLVVFWGALFGLAVLAGVTTMHADGIYEKIVSAKLPRDMVQQIKAEAISATELMDLAGYPDCRNEKEGRQTFVYRAFTQRRYENLLFFITTKVGYVTWERLDIIRFENGALAKHLERTEIYQGKAKDIEFDCDSLILE